jgi:type IV secretory pathway TraG/TraD family ATPase VirD4
MESQSHNRRHEPLTERELLLYALLIVAVVVLGASYWLLSSVLFLRPKQIVAIGGVAAIFLYGIGDISYYFATRKAKILAMWPRRQPQLSITKRLRYIHDANAKRELFLGTDSLGEPITMTEDQRCQQGIMFGMSGSGKTSILESIAQQDIAMGYPLIFLDGKGELKLLDRLQQWAAASGRIQDFHAISPEHAFLSSVYNPCACRTGESEEHFSFIFDAFSDNGNPFFDAVQRDFLLSVGNVLSYCGKTFSFKDIMVCAQEPEQMLTVLQLAERNARTMIDLDKHTLDQLRLNLRVLHDGLTDENRIYNIKNLMNKITMFLSKEMSLITGGADRLITIDNVIDRRQILFVSLNINVKSQSTVALGRMLLSNLQLVIGRRYSQTAVGTSHPFVSVILDEFAPFAYPQFARILQTARDARCGMLLALQSVNQLNTVGVSFGDEVSAAPNNKFALRVSDKATSDAIMQASGQVLRKRPTFQIRKTGVFGGTITEQDSGYLSNVRESVIEDQWLKYQPLGQCEFLRASTLRGMTHHHVHLTKPLGGLLSVVPDATTDSDQTEFSGVKPGIPVPVVPYTTTGTADESSLNLEYTRLDVNATPERARGKRR